MILTAHMILCWVALNSLQNIREADKVTDPFCLNKTRCSSMGDCSSGCSSANLIFTSAADVVGVILGIES